MKALHMIAWILVVVGGLNWLLTAFNWNMVEKIFGQGTPVTMIIYILIGLSALYELFTHKQACKTCSAPAPTAM
ncbi:MAG: DUF378 domain-containing protein [Patescibacteria group bacterium]